MTVFRCIDCNEPDSRGTLPGGRCRDCDIAHVVGGGSCRECGRWIKREDLFGPYPSQHAVGCPLAHAEDWRPLPMHDDVRKAACGALLDAASDYERQIERHVRGGDNGTEGAVDVESVRTIVADLRRKAAGHWPLTPATEDS